MRVDYRYMIIRPLVVLKHREIRVQYPLNTVVIMISACYLYVLTCLWKKDYCEKDLAKHKDVMFRHDPKQVAN